MSPPRPKCFKCIYFDMQSRKTKKYKCKAYLEGIPKDIIEGAFHNAVRKDQKGTYIFKERR